MSNCSWFCSETQKDNQKASKPLPLIWHPNHLYPTCCCKHQASKSTVWTTLHKSSKGPLYNPFLQLSFSLHLQRSPTFWVPPVTATVCLSWVSLRSHSLSFIKPPRRTSSFPSSSFSHSITAFLASETETVLFTVTIWYPAQWCSYAPL